MRQSRTSGSEGALGERSPRATRPRTCHSRIYEDTMRSVEPRSSFSSALGRASIRRRSQAWSCPPRSPSSSLRSLGAPSLPRDRPRPERRPVAPERAPRAGGRSQLPPGMRARALPARPVFDPSEPRASDRRGGERARSGARHEVRRRAIGPRGEPGLPSTWIRARRSLPRARSPHAAGGAQRTGVRPSQCEAARRQAGAAPLEDSRRRSGVVGEVVRGMALASRAAGGVRSSRRGRRPDVAAPRGLAAQGIDRSLGGAGSREGATPNCRLTRSGVACWDGRARRRRAQKLDSRMAPQTNKKRRTP